MQLSSDSLTRSRFLYDSLVTVLVGSQETRFDLHRGLLCASSDFFRAVITSDFKERAQNEIKFPEQDVKIFRFFVHWLYTGRLRGFYYPETIKPTVQELRKAAIAELENQNSYVLEYLAVQNPCIKAFCVADYRDAPFSHLIGLYILADTFLVHGLKDLIIDLIVDVYCRSRLKKVAEDEDGAQGSQQEGEDPDEAESCSSDEAESCSSDGTLSSSSDEAESSSLDEAESSSSDEVEASLSYPRLDRTEEYTTPFWNIERPPGLEDPCQAINMAWEALPRSSPLCQLIVECFCDNVILVEEYTNERQYHPGFLAAFAQSYALRLANVAWAGRAFDWDKKGQICKFHEHSAPSECPFARRYALRRKSQRSD